jgi:molecular chaperone IbpA
MAVAGFSEQDIDIESKDNSLIIIGTKVANTTTASSNKEDQVPRKFLHQGIAERNFERKFQLGEHVKVIGAFMKDGLLHVDLQREIPEALKPRKIAINGKSLLHE